MRNACNILVRIPYGKDLSEDPGIDGRIILEWTLGKYGGGGGLNSSGSGLGTTGGLL
jgi:hypothetical protein